MAYGQTMSAYDIFLSPHYSINYFYCRVLGLWPLDNYKLIKRIIVVATVTSLIIPQVIRLFEEWNRDIDIAIEVVGSLIYFCGCLTKYLSCVRLDSQMIFLFDKIANDWKAITHRDEMKLLEKYGAAGRQLTLGYLITINMILVVYITSPLKPLLFDTIDPLNGTRAKELPNYVEYLVDEQKYYFQLTVHGWIGCILSVQIFGCFDTTYACCAQHACTLFSIVEIRMRRAAEIATSNKYSNKWKREEDEFKSMREAILLHKQAIQFIDDMEKCYSLVLFLNVTLNSAVIGIATAMLSIKKGNFKHATRFSMLHIGYSFQLLYNTSPGQKVIDHSTDVHNAVYNCEWYNVSPRTRKLLGIVMLRSSRPCKLTARKLIELSLESFSNVFTKSLSYATVFASMR